jgi:flotillin
MFLLGMGLVASIIITILFMSMIFRRVVETDEVHIVQSSKKTISYGKDTGNGNSYYEWTSWLPIIGLTKKVLPTSVFDLTLDGYEAYDRGRLPFVVDVKAFFRIEDSNVAAQRVASFEELLNQLKAIVQGSIRTILATNEIEVILQGRSTFGEQFTEEVREQLKSWGVSTVKNIELMDIRDSKDSQVIRNIMEKKKSFIEMESRTEVAKNNQIAQTAEIEAKREVDLQEQIANQSVGLKTIDVERELALQNERKNQNINEQQKITKEKEMEVLKVSEVRQAEIDKEVNVVKATQDKEVLVVKSQADKESLILVAEGNLEAKKKEAEGIQVEGTARADAEKQMQLAPVEAQIVLAKEIGKNKEYQEYLITIRQVEANQVVGVEQAKALVDSDLKVIVNSSDASEGIGSLANILSSKGGTNMGAMLEGLGNTDLGKSLLDKILGKKE